MIDFKIFFYSLIIGIFISYIFQKKKKIIYVYPTPDNIKDIQYRDKTNTCFSFKLENIECNDNFLQKYHIQ